MQEAVPSTTAIHVAVAYAQRHPLFDACKTAGIPLVFYGLLDAEAAVSPLLLTDFLNQDPGKVECRLLKGNFHPKVIWWHGFGAYIGSANLTHAAWFHNVEAGIFLHEEELEATGVRNDLEILFEYIREKSIPLTQELLSHLGALEAERRALRKRASTADVKV